MGKIFQKFEEVWEKIDSFMKILKVGMKFLEKCIEILKKLSVCFR